MKKVRLNRQKLPFIEIKTESYPSTGQMFSIDYLGYKIIIDEFSATSVIKVQKIDDPDYNIFESQNGSQSSITLLALAMSEIEALS